MKKWWFILIILIIAGLGFLIYKGVSKNNSYDFQPSISQGVYGTALECHGSAEPPLKGKWNSIQLDFDIKNLETNQTFKIKTEANGRYEYKLEEGAYMIIVDDGSYAQINIEKDALIQRNIVTKFCPV